MNNIKVFLLMAAMMAIFGVVGGAIANQEGMFIALAFGAMMNFMMYFNSANTAMRSYGAQTVTPEQAPKLYETVDALRRKAGLPMPKVAIAPHPQPNAFATGRNSNNAVVCATQGLLQLVSQDELEGVMAHELGHIKNRDMLLQTISATMAGAITNLARVGILPQARAKGRSNPLAALMVVVAPLAAMIIQFAISRQREFEADEAGAEISGKPLALASALAKMQAGAEATPMAISPTFALLAQVNPLSGLSGLSRLFSTHPSTKERIARLQKLAKRADPTTNLAT